MIRDQRCPLRPEVEAPLRIAARNAGVSHCQLAEEFIVAGLATKQLEADCAQGIQDERCKYIRPK